MSEIISGYMIKILILFAAGTTITCILYQKGKKLSSEIPDNISTQSFDKMPVNISLILYVILVAAFGVAGLVSGLLRLTFRGVGFALVPVLVLWIVRQLKNTGHTPV